MIIIGFACKTSKILPQVCCKHFKHVAPIIIDNDKLQMYQFIKRGKIKKICLKMRDIKTLGKHGWYFVYLTGIPNLNLENKSCMTCVQFTKHIIGIKSWTIQTPWQLYQALK